MDMKQLLQLMESANSKPMRPEKRSLTESEIYKDPRWDKYAEFMPPSGPSDRHVGELFRAVAKITYDYYNNGFGNDWSEAAAFLMKHIELPNEVKEMFLQYGMGNIPPSHTLDNTVELMGKVVLDALDQIDPEQPNDTDMWETDISPYNWDEDTEEPWGDDEEEDDIWGDEEEDSYYESSDSDGQPLRETLDPEIVYEFQEAMETIMEQAEHAFSMLPSGIIQDRARSYWYGHIMSAVGSESYGGGSSTSMQDTLAELQAEIDVEDQEESLPDDQEEW